MFASAVGAIQRLPVQGNLLDKNKTPIEDANLPSNRGMLITEVKGHYPLAREEVERLAMQAVLVTERTLGRMPRDVSAQRGLGYDIESKDPQTGALFFIEVKGRWIGKNDITLTKNEILCSRNEPERFRLALVTVAEDGAQAPRYLRDFGFGEPDFAETTRTFSLRKLLDYAGDPM